MTDPAEYKNNWMKYATSEEIAAYSQDLDRKTNPLHRITAPVRSNANALETEVEELERQLGATTTFSEALALAQTLAEKRKAILAQGNEETLMDQLLYFGSSRLSHNYYHACRVIYRIGVEVEDLWCEINGRKDPTEDLFERLEYVDYRQGAERRDQDIFQRVKKAVDEEVADRPGVTPGRDGGLRYIFNIEHILDNDPWSRYVQNKLISMNQWSNVMGYAYDKILEKLSRVDRYSFDNIVQHHKNFRGYGYWDNGELILLEEQIQKYQKIK